ncbi:hypothetical protein BS78_K071700 [Paspalum vaginatum]|uniref:Uncharacterized protein n=1 Tax=Paspalum vaginatum TaxID=158149 RepID=A0A9W8CET8_9POAL|nr:hypothetical protein BS78_K071700 [Paspalum vaginatum]
MEQKRNIPPSPCLLYSSFSLMPPAHRVGAAVDIAAGLLVLISWPHAFSVHPRSCSYPRIPQPWIDLRCRRTQRRDPQWPLPDTVPSWPPRDLTTSLVACAATAAPRSSVLTLVVCVKVTLQPPVTIWLSGVWLLLEPYGVHQAR